MIPFEAASASTRCGGIYFVRHCRTEWNDATRLQGGQDVELSAVGRAQAKALGERVRGLGIKVLVTSTLMRAHETASIIGERCNGRLVTCADLGEIRFGDMEGLTLEECEAMYPDTLKLWRQAPQSVRFPNGEAVRDFEKRIMAGLCLTLGLLSEPALFVLHGGVLRMAKCLLEQLPVSSMNTFAIGNGELYRLQAMGEGVEMVPCVG
ncbi:MAG: histidine phosphatase family protein [Thermodesulfobacteriota bacterium]